MLEVECLRFKVGGYGFEVWLKKYKVLSLKYKVRIVSGMRFNLTEQLNNADARSASRQAFVLTE
jgi:hypothetical protein